MEIISKKELKYIYGGNKFQVPKGQQPPKFCPYCCSTKIVSYKERHWICADCGSTTDEDEK